MPRLLRYIAYLILFAVSFVVFLYWLFPYEVLRDRIAGMIERQSGGALQVTIDELEPYWFTGVDISNLLLEAPGPEGTMTILKLRRAQARAGLFSLLFGSPDVAFDLEIGRQGEISGFTATSAESVELDLELDDLNLGEIGLIRRATGLILSSRIDGSIDLAIDRGRPVRSEGRIDLDPRDIAIQPSTVRLGEMEIPLPQLDVTKGRGSAIKMEMGKGVVTVEQFKLAGGDLELELSGKVFLSTRPENYRLNLNGSFKPSQKLGDVLPFLFIVEKQQREDGSYPLSITGRLSRPAVKIGTFSLPL